MSTGKTTVFYTALIAVASLAIGMVLASRMDLSPPSTAQTLRTAVAETGAPLNGGLGVETFRIIAREQSPMVVNISTESRRRGRTTQDFFGDELFDRFFGRPDPQPRDEIMTGAGTGFIIDQSGLILTNNHVVEEATKIQVGFFNDDYGDLFDAKVIGRDPLTDSALIELVDKPSGELPVATLGDSDQLGPGDWVMAIGNPFNIGHSVTVGVISALERQFRVSEGRDVYMLQTDAAINPGNSGGPLLNVRGEVVGINTAILSDRAANLGIGFAVPINLVKELLPELRTGKVTRGRIGVSIQPVQRDALEALGLDRRRGALVSSVESGGPADRAGVRPGDVVVAFSGQEILNSRDLVDRVVRTAPGSTVPMEIIRDGATQTLQVTVAELDLQAEGTQDQAETTDEAAGFGLTLQDLTPEIARQIRVPPGTTGAVVSDIEPRSPAARAGLQRGDVIIEVNRTAVASATEASRALGRVRSGSAALVLILRRGQEIFTTMTKE